MAGAVGEDTRQSIQDGRETLGAMLSAAQSDLKRVFIVALLGLLGSIYVFQTFLWETLKDDLHYRMSETVASEVKIIAVTPFDVILLQVKIGLVVGLLLAIPLFIWYSRDALRQRGFWPGEAVPKWKAWGIALLGLSLMVTGVAYAYFLFFPFMLDFLATNAVNAGFKPTYSIVKWAQFVFLLTLSFALAAQLPLVMSALGYTGIVPYETFRDKWRYAVVGIFAFGAVFSPPDPFTQIMWAAPLLVLYAFSLQLTKLVVIAKRSSAHVDVSSVLLDRWNVLAGATVLTAGGVYAFLTRGGIGALNEALAIVGWGPVNPIGETLGLPEPAAAAIVAAGATLAVLVAVVLYVLGEALAEADRAHQPAPASVGTPADIDLGTLDAAGVRAAPPEVFEDLTEDEAVAKAREAMDAERPEKADAILARFDEVQERLAAAEDAADAADAAAAAGESTGSGAGESEGSTATQTAAGMVDAFTESETTEDDIGGYYYDVAFILESLTSKAFRIVAVFMLVMGGTFAWFYTGGIRWAKDVFFGRMPAGMGTEEVGIVALHPVEVLIFEVKFSTLLAIVATVPLVLYYSWPAMKERGIVRGDPRVMLVWGGSLIVGVVAGILLGFLFVAPAIISWLASDAIRSNMIVAYRINNFGWLVIYTTVGIGLLAEIPVSMVLFQVGDVASFHTMRKHWRTIVVGIFAAAAFLSPRGIFTMLLLAIPVSLAYLVGLAVLWVFTLGGRRGRPGQPEPVPE